MAAKPIVMLIGVAHADTRAFMATRGWKLFRKLIGIVNIVKAEASVVDDIDMILKRVRLVFCFNMRSSATNKTMCRCHKQNHVQIDECMLSCCVTTGKLPDTT